MSESPRKLDLELFPPEIIALNREVAHHPELMKIIAQQENKDVYIRLLEIATYCNVLVVGDFTHRGILDLCETLTKKLYEKRTQLIIPYR